MRIIPAGFKGSPLRFRTEKWFWTVLTVAVVVADVWFPVFWGRISIVYLAVVSNYALVATFAGAEQAAEAKQARPSARRLSARTPRRPRGHLQLPAFGDGIVESLFDFSLAPFQFPGVHYVAHRSRSGNEGVPCRRGVGDLAQPLHFLHPLQQRVRPQVGLCRPFGGSQPLGQDRHRCPVHGLPKSRSGRYSWREGVRRGLRERPLAFRQRAVPDGRSGRKIAHYASVPNPP